MNKWLISIPVALAMASGAAQAAGSAEAGKAKSAVCMACHGPDGNSPANPLWPKLSGQHAAYLVKQMHDLKKGELRKDPTMAPMLAPLADQDMEDLAAYFSSQTRNSGVAAADKASAGEKLFRGGNPTTGVAACMACHGPDGMGNPTAGFPTVAGQHAPYVEKAIKDFRSGARQNDMNNMMRDVAAKMTDAEIAAVAQYIQGLQ